MRSIWINRITIMIFAVLVGLGHGDWQEYVGLSILALTLITEHIVDYFIYQVEDRIIIQEKPPKDLNIL